MGALRQLFERGATCAADFPPRARRARLRHSFSGAHRRHGVQPLAAVHRTDRDARRGRVDRWRTGVSIGTGRGADVADRRLARRRRIPGARAFAWRQLVPVFTGGGRTAGAARDDLVAPVASAGDAAARPDDEGAIVLPATDPPAGHKYLCCGQANRASGQGRCR